MAIRPEDLRRPDEELERKFFTLHVTSHTVEIGDKSRKTHPVFDIHLKTGGKKLIGGIEMEVLGASFLDQSVVLKLKNYQEQEPLQRRFSVADISEEGNILRFGQDGLVFLWAVDEDQRAHFTMAFARDIRVVSPNGV